MKDPGRSQNETDRLQFNKPAVKLKLINSQLTAPISGPAKWSELYEDLNWPSLFVLARQITKETKLQIFQFKTLHRILPTREKQFLWQKTDSKFCLHCPNVTHDIKHMLLQCPNAMILWNNLKSIFQTYENREIEISEKSVIFGLKSGNKKIKFWNYLALILKYYIYQCHIRKISCTWPAAENFLKYKLKIDNYIGTTKHLPNKLKQLENWKRFIED